MSINIIIFLKNYFSNRVHYCSQWSAELVWGFDKVSDQIMYLLSNITIVLPSILRLECRLGRLSISFAANLVVLTFPLIPYSGSMYISSLLNSRTTKDNPFWLSSSSIIKVMMDSKNVALTIVLLFGVDLSPQLFADSFDSSTNDSPNDKIIR